MFELEQKVIFTIINETSPGGVWQDSSQLPAAGKDTGRVDQGCPAVLRTVHECLTHLPGRSLSVAVPVAGRVVVFFLLWLQHIQRT